MRLREFNQRSPIGGHHFRESDGTLLRAGTKDDLLDAIRNHRLVNGLPTGDLEHDLAVFYANVAPHWVENGASESQIRDETLALDWLNRLWGTRPPFLLRQDALLRAKVCEGCPCMKKVSGGPESTELRRRAVILSGGLMPPLGVCTHHKWHCGIAALLKEPCGRPDAPGNCWASSPLGDTKSAESTS